MTIEISPRHQYQQEMAEYRRAAHEKGIDGLVYGLGVFVLVFTLILFYDDNWYALLESDNLVALLALFAAIAGLCSFIGYTIGAQDNRTKASISYEDWYEDYMQQRRHKLEALELNRQINEASGQHEISAYALSHVVERYLLEWENEKQGLHWILTHSVAQKELELNIMKEKFRQMRIENDLVKLERESSIQAQKRRDELELERQQCIINLMKLQTGFDAMKAKNADTIDTPYNG